MNYDSERREKIVELCDQALDLDLSERAAFLDAACGDDEKLREGVESLLKHEATARDFLAQPAWAQFAGRVAAQWESLEGKELGHYRIRERLGAGGMGEVWKAWDERLKRDVAIKILPPEFSADPDRVRRFEQEAYTVSALNHPNIITIHEVGQTGELHYIVTEFIEGRTLRDLLGTRASSVRTQGSWREDVLIAAQIAGALSAAHTAGVIHRDIKPENVMAQEGRRVKVLDFGIAKKVGVVAGDGGDQPVTGIETRLGVRAGTLKYMSPEQARGESLDARTDIFSLGLVLYEMIAGRHPFAGKSDEEIIAALKSEDEIPPVSLENNRIPAALDRLVAKALRKNRGERYASAEEMLVELRQLESLIEVSPDEKQRRTFKARNANQLLTQFAVFYDADKKTRAPLGGLWSVWRAADLEAGRLEREMMRRSLFSGLANACLWILLVAAITMGIAAWMSVREEFEEQAIRDGHTAAVRRAVFSPDGRLLVSVGEDNKVIVWDFARRQRLATFDKDHTGWTASVAFSPDGKWFATASYDKTVIVWDAVNLKKEIVLRGHLHGVVIVAFSPNGKTLVSAASQPEPVDNSTILWRAGSWERFAQIPVHGAEANSLLFLPGSSRMIYPYNVFPDSANTWDVATGQSLTQQFDPAWNGNNAALSPDGALLVSITTLGEVIFAAFKGRRTLSREQAHQDNGRAVAFSPDGRLVVTGAENIILWDAATRRRITTIDYPSIVWSAAFSPGGRWLVTTHGDGSIRVWDMVERRHAVGFNEHNGSVRAVAWSRDGKRFASAGEDLAVMVWNAESGNREMLLSGHPTRVTGLAFAPDGGALASVDRDGTIIIWDLAERRERLKFGHPVEKIMPGNCLVFSPDGRALATSYGVYDSASGRQVADFNVKGNDWLKSSAIYGLAFSADGKRLAVANSYGLQSILETATWQIVERAELRSRQFISVSFSPDGKQIVTGEDGGTVQLWTAQPLQPTEVIGKHDARVKSVAFSPDGSTVVSAGDDKMIALWDVSSRKLITKIGLHTAPVYAVAFSPDGKRLVSGGHDHSVRLYTRHRGLWGWRWD